MPVRKSSTLPIRSDPDVVQVRQAVRNLAVELKFGLVDQTKVVTAASELARKHPRTRRGRERRHRSHRRRRSPGACG